MLLRLGACQFDARSGPTRSPPWKFTSFEMLMSPPPFGPLPQSISFHIQAPATPTATPEANARPGYPGETTATGSYVGT